ncbi:hypothetical protein IC582_023900 [Cucumis melo]
MLIVWKEFRRQNHRHFKKFNNPEHARANPPPRLSNRVQNWHFLYDYYLTRQFQEQSSMNKAAKAKQPYNHIGVTEQRVHSIDCAELFRKTHARGGQLVLQAATDAHVTYLVGSQQLFRDGIYETVLRRRPSYSKDLGWGPKPKSQDAAGSSSSTFVERALAHAREVNELKTFLEVVEEESSRKYEENIRLIEAQTRQMEEMRKMIEDLFRASRGH